MKLKPTLLATLLTCGLTATASAQAAAKPNILIIFPDDVGWSNGNAYGNGVTGYTTPNIDRPAREGIMFTEHFATSEGFYEPWVEPKFPMVMNIHVDPCEQFQLDTDITYGNERKQWLLGPMQARLTERVKSLVKYPPLQVAPTFDLSKITAKVTSGAH